MDLSRARSRRGVVAALVAGAFARILPEPVRAQLNAGCEYNIVNGLVTIGGDNCNVAVPGHMIDARSDTNSTSGNSTSTSTNATTSVDSPNEIRQERLQRRRDHKRDKRYRRTNQKQDQKSRRHERKILCEDFSSQLQAVEAMAQNPWAAKKLDPDGDGVPCEDLRELTCGEFRDEAEATNWFNRMGYSKDFDPFKLFDKDAGSVCASFRVTCDDFRTQKEAVEWITEHPRDKKRLDQGDKKAPCPDLPTVTCKSFSDAKEAANWFTQNGFTENDDPYGLWDKDLSRVCPEKVTCDSFVDQKEAVEWMAQHGDPKGTLDPDQDGRPCKNLKAVTCSQLYAEENDAEGVTAWFYLYFDDNDDPYKLRGKDENDIMVVCPAKG